MESVASIAMAGSVSPTRPHPGCSACRWKCSSANRYTRFSTATLLKIGPATKIARCGVPPQAPGSASGEDNIYRSDGSFFPAEYAVTPILDHGRFLGSVLRFRDISQRYALDQLKDEFISTVSHELRTPLTSIRGALGLSQLRHAR